MELKGCTGVTGRMCSQKFKNLKTRFKIIKKRRGKTGSAGEPTWPYYHHMEELLRNDKTIHPDNLIEAGAGGFNRVRRN